MPVYDRLPPSYPIGPQVTPEGHVRLPVRAATFGRVPYEQGIAWVDPEALADPEYLASMIGNPVYLEEHPDEPTPPGYAEAHSVGEIVSREYADGEIYTELEIRHPRGLAYGDARGWAVCASLGYQDRKEYPGKNGADFVQKRVRNYHITLTDTPRHGPRARAINTAYDSIGGSMLEKLIEMLVSMGVDPEKAKAGAPALMEAMKPAAPPEDADPKKANPESVAAMDSLRRQAADALKARDAAVAALDAERIESCREAVVGAAKAAGLTVGDSKADVPALAAQVLAARGVSRTGLDAAMFLRDAARLGVVGDKTQTQASDSQRRAGTPDPTPNNGGSAGAVY